LSPEYHEDLLLRDEERPSSTDAACPHLCRRVGATLAMIVLIFEDRILYPTPPEHAWAAALMTLNANLRDSESQQIGGKPDELADEMNPSKTHPIRSIMDLSLMFVFGWESFDQEDTLRACRI
jgi:hypothetical protein